LRNDLYECDKRKKSHFSWKLTLDQFRVLCKKPCTYCDGAEWGKGLDRKNNKGDYTIENVLPCCRTCNRIRGDDITVGEIRHLLELRGVDVAVKPLLSSARNVCLGIGVLLFLFGCTSVPRKTYEGGVTDTRREYGEAIVHCNAMVEDWQREVAKTRFKLQECLEAGSRDK